MAKLIMITAIIQARMTSTRLPGKVLKEVLGRPLLSYQLERLKSADNIYEIIIATTINKKDDPIVLFATKENLPFYRGSEEDVLDRYYQTAKAFNVDHIMRITSDCPLIDPQVCDRVAEVYHKSDVDFVHTGPTFAEGVDCEVFSFKALEKTWHEIGLKSEREHVTRYMHNHPELFKRVALANETDDGRYRFTVDEQDDFLVVVAILEALYGKGKKPFTTGEVKEFLDSHPEVFRLNAHIKRNEGLARSLEEEKKVERGISI